nr:MerR family transcriptional regulator [Desulfogranum japonicum]
MKIPDKKYFRIGEVSTIVGVDTHVLRYWESEFKNIRPVRGKSKQRLYRRQDIDNLLLIRNLLHYEGYTISGARKLLERRAEENTAYYLYKKNRERERLRYIKNELTAIIGQLKSTV